MSALFETWTLKQELPDPFARIVRESGGKRTSVKEKDCSTYNTGKAKSATLHPPTLWAILGLIELIGGYGSGAAGFQAENEEVNFFVWSMRNRMGNTPLSITAGMEKSKD